MLHRMTAPVLILLALLAGPAGLAPAQIIVDQNCTKLPQVQQNMIDRHLAHQAQLETEYPEVSFVYRAGHLNRYRRTNINALSVKLEP